MEGGPFCTPRSFNTKTSQDGYGYRRNIEEIFRTISRFQIDLTYCLSILSTEFILFTEFIYRSSHQRCSMRKGVLRNFAKFTGKHLGQSLFFNKVVGLRPAALLKRRLWPRCFPVNFVKFLRTPFFTEHLWATASVFKMSQKLSTSHISLDLTLTGKITTSNELFMFIILCIFRFL